MKRIPKLFVIILVLAVVLAVTGCDTLREAGLIESDQTGLHASGSIEAVSVLVSSEQGGTLLEVSVSEGDRVEVGDVLFRLQDDVLDGQQKQAQAALETALSTKDLAETGVKSAEVALEIARMQYQMALEAARQEVQTLRGETWKDDQPDAFLLPTWYFMQAEGIQAARDEVAAAEEDLAGEEQNLEILYSGAAFNDLKEVEGRLSDAQAAYLVAELVLERANAQTDRDLRDFAQQNFDTAEAELEAAQTAYDRLLTDADNQDVMEARARVAVARERYETAQDEYQRLLTGKHSRSVELASLWVDQAQTALTQAQAQVDQAEKVIAQAQAQLDMFDVYLEKLSVHAPLDGVVRSRNVQPGEVLQPGVAALVIDQLDRLTLTVYFPEDQYGQIALGDTAVITVDSFPGETFKGTVIRIADRAEYTPRNVQTQEERVTTVFAIEISILNPEGKLKPGMPADAWFE